MNNQTPDKELLPKKFIPGIAWFFLILVAISIPGYDLPEVDQWLIEINYDKLIHVFLFAVLAYLFMLPVVRSGLPVTEKWHWLIKITIATVIWGITTELIQKFFIPGRSFNLSDWAADGLGGVFVLIYFKIKQKKLTRGRQ